jgi:hypothetical protein
MVFDRPWRHATALWSPSVALSSGVLSSLSSISSPRALLPSIVALCLTANIASALFTYPHTLSYFNELAGGPLNGPAHLLDANVDWGQDLLFLKDSYDANPDARPLRLAYFGVIHPNVAGVEFEPVSHATRKPSGVPTGRGHNGDPITPSVSYALSVNELYGYKHFGERGDEYALPRGLLLQQRVGASIRIYRFPTDTPSRRSFPLPLSH